MKVLVTGCAGFIGMHVAQRLLTRGDEVVGVDNLNGYYSPLLKQARLAQLIPQTNFRFQWLDIADRNSTAAFFEEESFDRVVHLAAQAGVRYSLNNPQAYVDSNLVGFANVLEGCRQQVVAHLVYASSSSVQGGNTKIPFAETDPVDQPATYADVGALKAWVGFSPDTPLAEGLSKFVAWYCAFYGGIGVYRTTFET